MIEVTVAPRSRMRRLMEQVIPADIAGQVKIRQVDWSKRPRQADVVVSAAALSSSVERYAARLGAPGVVILPEAYDWLQQKIRQAVEVREDLTIVDAAFATVDPLMAVSK